MQDLPQRDRLLFISRNFPPLTGGMERLNYHAYLALRTRYRISVCAPNGAADFIDAGDDCLEVPLIPLSRFLATCQWRSWRMARQARPAVVYSGSGLTAPAALIAGRAVGARVVSFLHGLDVIADHPVYRRLFLPAIARCDRLLVNSHYTAGLALRIGVPEARITVVHPGVDIPDLSRRAQARMRFRQRYGLGDRPVLLSVGRLTERKGLVEFIHDVLPAVIREYPDTVLVVVGDEPSQALKHRGGVRENIAKVAQAMGVAANVLMTGRVDDAALSECYFASDLMVFPVVEIPGDVEGFGMVAIEAAAHGLPTVAYAAGGVIDAVAEGRSGWLVSPGDHRHMIDVILRVVGDPAGSRQRMSESSHQLAAGKFSWDEFGRRMLFEIECANQ